MLKGEVRRQDGSSDAKTGTPPPERGQPRARPEQQPGRWRQIGPSFFGDGTRDPTFLVADRGWAEIRPCGADSAGVTFLGKDPALGQAVIVR